MVFDKHCHFLLLIKKVYPSTQKMQAEFSRRQGAGIYSLGVNTPPLGAVKKRSEK
jgi:hypothetical protein